MTIRTDGGGLRYSKGKPRVELLPPDALLEVGKVYAFGATKYTARNWERGMKWSEVLGPLLRHTFRFMMGYKYDAESKCLHSAHIVWNAIALLTYELRGIGKDDRNIIGQAKRTLQRIMRKVTRRKPYQRRRKKRTKKRGSK